jgi:hypothetical protein
LKQLIKENRYDSPTIPIEIVSADTGQQFCSNAVSKIGGYNNERQCYFHDCSRNSRITLKITNSGDKGAYLSTGNGSATAVVSTATPTPAADPNAVTIANCDYIAAGAIITQDYVQGTDTIAAICAAAESTTLEISIGYGQ